MHFHRLDDILCSEAHKIFFFSFLQNSVEELEKKGSRDLILLCKPVVVSEIIDEIVHTRPREAKY